MAHNKVGVLGVWSGLDGMGNQGGIGLEGAGSISGEIGWSVGRQREFCVYVYDSNNMYGGVCVK